MNDHLTAEQIARYREDGFLVIENFLSPEEVETWRKTLEAAVSSRGQTRILGAEEGGKHESDYYNNVFIQRVNLWQSDPAIKPLILDQRIGKMACELEGLDGIRVWHDQALIKRPWDNPTAWHLDNPYWSFYSRHAISIWIALDDATLENGCLWFLPGTHKLATYDNVGIGPNMRAIFQAYPQWQNIESVPAVMKAGDCSFHNGLTCHGAGANMTHRWRRAMTCAFMPEGSTFNGNKNILTDEMIARLDEGDPLCDDAFNPVVWSRNQHATV